MLMTPSTSEIICLAVVSSPHVGHNSPLTKYLSLHALYIFVKFDLLESVELAEIHWLADSQIF